MGQTCEGVCGQSNSPHVSEINQSYLKLIQSKQVDQDLPLQFLPETVRERISLLKLKVNYADSQLWKYQEPKNQASQSEQALVIYTLINREDIAKPGQSSPESQQVIVATSQPPLSNSQGGQNQAIGYRFDPHRFTDAAIFVFRQKQNPQTLSNPYAEDSQKLQFEQFYFGAVNQKMSQANAAKIFKNGEYYIGNMEDYSLEGNKGVGRNALGNHSYDGSWAKNRPEGHGVEELDGKFKFEGEFKSGKWNGRGKLTLVNTAYPIHLEGNFVDGTLEGRGTIRNELNELIYEGDFKNGLEHGKGAWYGSNKDKYEGDFVDGKKQGEGVFTFGSGNIYQGSFKNGRPEGKGLLTKGGIKTQGYWFNGENIMVSKDQQQ